MTANTTFTKRFNTLVQPFKLIQEMTITIYIKSKRKRPPSSSQHSCLGAPTDNTQMSKPKLRETNVSISIPITISPATPSLLETLYPVRQTKGRTEIDRRDQGKEKRTLNNAFRPKRTISVDIERRVNDQKSKKM